MNPMSTKMLSVSLLIASAGVAFAQARAPAGILIESARYGSKGASCDATALLKRVCDGKALCQIRADENLCGLPGTDNALQINFRCNGASQSAAIGNGRNGDLVCKRS